METQKQPQPQLLILNVLIFNRKDEDARATISTKMITDNSSLTKWCVDKDQTPDKRVEVIVDHLTTSVSRIRVAGRSRIKITNEKTFQGIKDNNR